MPQIAHWENGEEALNLGYTCHFWTRIYPRQDTDLEGKITGKPPGKSVTLDFPTKQAITKIKRFRMFHISY